MTEPVEPSRERCEHLRVGANVICSRGVGPGAHTGTMADPLHITEPADAEPAVAVVLRR